MLAVGEGGRGMVERGIRRGGDGREKDKEGGGWAREG